MNEEDASAKVSETFFDAMDIARRVKGRENPGTLTVMSNLADILLEEGRYTEAEKLIRETLDIRRRVRGPEIPETAEATYNLGRMAPLQGSHTEALSLLRQALDHGLKPADALDMEKNPRLKSLHGAPGFDALVADAKQRVAAAQKPK